MSMSRSMLVTVGLSLALWLDAAAMDDEASPRLGEAIGPEAVAEVDYVVLPDGSGLPEGGGNAREGAAVYAEHCLACHGDEGVGGINDELAGGHGSIDSEMPVKTVGSYWPYATTVFDYIRRAMPYQDPGSLGNDEIYALTAYLLYINGIIDAEDRIDAATLPSIRMPNRENFVWAYTPRLRAQDPARSTN